MTSMPASRSARAMTFAPRSCPSRPGFAITTRIFFAIRAAVYGREADRRGLEPRVAEPRRRAIRLPRRGAGPAPARLRPGRARTAREHERRLAARRLDRHHALAPRPLGRPRAVGLGEHGRARQGEGAAPSSGSRLRVARASATSERASAGRTCSRRRSTCATTRRPSRSGPRRGSRCSRSACRTTRCARTACGSRTASTRSRTRATPARTSGSTEVARDADLFVCEGDALRGELDGSPRGHLSVDEAVDAFEASGAKRLLLTHRPDELPPWTATSSPTTVSISISEHVTVAPLEWVAALHRCRDRRSPRYSHHRLASDRENWNGAVRFALLVAGLFAAQ